MAFKGIGDKYSDKIIAGRPYAKKDQLVSKDILPEATYKKIAGQIIARSRSNAAALSERIGAPRAGAFFVW